MPLKRETLLIRGGTVVDGTGAPPVLADVAIADGHITGIGTHLSGHDTLDASGHVVSPGFVDIHTHYDAQVFWDPWLTPSCYHGVTTVIAGNCGLSIAPVRPDGIELLISTLALVEDMSKATLSAGVPWHEFTSWPQYREALRRRGVALNFGTFVGHSALRLWTMGDDAYERPATSLELRQMTSTLAEAVTEGAMGFSSSCAHLDIGYGGRPVPSRLADEEEFCALFAGLSQAGRGAAQLLPAGEIPFETIFTWRQQYGRPITWIALAAKKGDPAYREVVALHDEARAKGIDVWPQISGRPIVFEMSIAKPTPWGARPSFAKMLGTGPLKDHVRQCYQDPAWRAQAWNELMSPDGPMPPFDWRGMWVASSPSHADLIGIPIANLSRDAGETPLDTVLKIALDDDLETRYSVVLTNDDEAGIAWMLGRDGLMLGLADSGAHVSQLCDACFSTDLLGKWVREREALSLTQAIRKLSGEPAEFLGLRDRGTLEVGKAADICIFDPDTVGPGKLRRVVDFPANGERLIADEPSGVRDVFVNGVLIRRDGQPCSDGLDARPGLVF